MGKLMSKCAVPRVFYLVRLEDETGTSGTGIVADGVQFQDGTCSLCWATDVSSVAVYKSIDDVKAIHGHGGKTRIMWEGMDFVHLPTRTPVIHDCAVYEPKSDGSSILVDGWPSPEKDYVRFSWYIANYGRRLYLRDGQGGG